MIRVTGQSGMSVTPTNIIIGTVSENVDAGVISSTHNVGALNKIKQYFEEQGYNVETLNPDNPNGVPPVKL